MVQQAQSSTSTINKSNRRFESSKINSVPQKKMMKEMNESLDDDDEDSEN